MKKIVFLISVVLLVGVLVSSCAGKKKCPAYSNKSNVELNFRL